MRKTICLAAIVAAAPSAAAAHPHDGEAGHDHGGGWVHENGIGPDPDGDSNPATDTRVLPFVGRVLVDAEGSTFPVVHFEPPPGTHGEPIIQDYYGKYGVKFGPGLSWQICEGQRHFQYNSMCTYQAPTSGRFAAGYRNVLNRPLAIEFDQPACLVTMSIYPTGAELEELFEFEIQGWDADDRPLDRARVEFEWENETVIFDNIAGAYFMDAPAKRITVSMKSLDEEARRKESEDKEDDREVDTLRYLIDDLAFISGSCGDAIDEVETRTGLELSARTYRLNREERN